MAEESRNKNLAGGAAVPSSSLSADLHQQHHPAADFPKLNQATDNIIGRPATNSNKNEAPDIARAKEGIPSIPNDRVFEIEHDDGTTESGTAAELMARADGEAAFADKAEVVYEKKVLMTIDMTPAINMPIIHFKTVRSVRIGASSC